MTKAEELLPLVQVIATIALLAGMSVIIFDEFQETQVTTITTVNDSVTFTAVNTAYNLDANSATLFFITTTNSSITVENSTIGALNRDGNWSVVPTSGTITATTGGQIAAGSVMNVSYTYTIGNDARNIFGEGTTGILEITSWLDLIALAVIAGAIMTIVLSSVGMLYYGKGNTGY